MVFRGLAFATLLALPAVSHRAGASGAVAAPGLELTATAAAAVSAATTAGLRIADRPRRRYVVAAIGDSLTDSRAGGGRYLGVLAARCPGSRFDAHGVGGQRTDHMRWRFERDVLGVGSPPGRARPQYTHVIVLGGINDLAAWTPRVARTERTRRNLAWMYERATQAGIEVVALTVPPWMPPHAAPDARQSATTALNSWITDQPRRGAVRHVVDLWPALECAGALCPRYRRFPADPIHWGRAGHEVVGATLFERLFADCR